MSTAEIHLTGYNLQNVNNNHCIYQKMNYSKLQVNKNPFSDFGPFSYIRQVSYSTKSEKRGPDINAS